MKARAARLGAAAITIAVMMSPRHAISQAEREPAEAVALRLDDFRLSGPPALSLLAVSASAVTRPNTPRDLIASLVSGAGSDGIVPNGFALETAPFWLTRQRSIGLRDYYNASVIDRLKYFTAISVATSRESGSNSTQRNAHVAIAIRTLLVNGRPSRALIAVSDSMRMQQLVFIDRYRRWESAQSRASGLETMKRQLAQQEDLLESLVTRVLVRPDTSLRDSTMRTLARRDSLRALVSTGQSAADDAVALDADLDRLETRLAALAKKFASEEIEPDGFILELAAGTRALFTAGEWGKRQSDGAGIWLTPMYRSSAHGFETMGVARYMSDVSEYNGRSVLDVGARAGIDAGKGSLSAEHTWRSVHGSGDLGLTSGNGPARTKSTRWSVIFDYPLGGKLWAVASFGSDYRHPDGTRPVIATVGINLGLGAIEIRPSPVR